MDGTFQRAVAYVIEDEGVHDADETGGGDTWYGLARRYHQDMSPWPPTIPQAIERYYRKYWLPYRLDELPPAVAYAVFDGIVQHDRSAVRMLQTCLGVLIDGKLGPRTIAAARATPTLQLLGEFCACRGTYYGHLPTFREKGHGWMRRIFRVHQRCLTWGGAPRSRHADRARDGAAA